MFRLFSELYIKPNTIIQIDDTKEIFKVEMCINLEFLDRTGYQLNLKKVLTYPKKNEIINKGFDNEAKL